MVNGAQQSELNSVIEKNVEPELQNVARNIVADNQNAPLLHYQGIFPRGFANIIDQIIVVLPVYALTRFLLGNASNEDNQPALAFSVIVLIIYFIIAESLYGQTIGKKLLKLRVAMTDGTKCTIKGALLRNVGRILDLLLGSYLLGMILIIVTPKKQRIGDFLANTVVVSA